MSTSDWRIKLFGETILLNSTNDDKIHGDLEQGDDGLKHDSVPSKVIPITSTSVEDFFEGYDYIALFFGANYCPICKEFAPHVVASKPYLESKKCKVIFVSNDRDLDKFHQSCVNIYGLDVMQYDTSKTAKMRDLFGLKTIPSLMILRNDGFDDVPQVVSNARGILEKDPKCTSFPWARGEMSTWERIWIHGRYGNWWQLGHTNVSDLHPEEFYVDEHAVRIRAGLLNIISWTAILNILLWRNPNILRSVFGLIQWEFLASMTFGLTPFAPISWIAVLMAVMIHPKPLWKPAKPKQFAWLIAMTLLIACFVLFTYRYELGSAYRPAILSVVITCNVATWLEGNAGFCVGCFIYNKVLVKAFNLEKCKECEL